jgi:hypothetical protein
VLHSGDTAAAPRGPALPAVTLAPVLAVAAFLVSFGALHYGFFGRPGLIDTPIYERYGDAIVHGRQVPYRDFAVEYPPGALPVFVAPALVADRGDLPTYARVFEALMLACGAAASALVAFVLRLQRASGRRLVAGSLLAGLAPLALGPLVLSRFDLWPACLTIAALAALLSERRRLAFGLLGAAIAAKVYPAVMLPLVLAFVWRRHGKREAAICAAILAGVLAVLVVPFAVVAPHGLWASLAGQASRPLQVETLGASFLLVGHVLWGLPLQLIPSHGSDNLGGGAAQALALVQGLLAPAVIAATWIAFARGRAEPERLVRFSAAAICAFVALGKVLSPQYLLWLIAPIALVRGRRGFAAGVLLVASLVLTQTWFPYRYISLVYAFDVRASWLVFARDLLLVALVVALLWPARRASRAGFATTALLVLVAAGAVGAAVSAAGARSGLAHSGLLAETGVRSSCAVAKRVPAQSAGIVPYEAATFANTSGGTACVVVTVTAPRDAQIFSAAYSGSFDSANPQARYLGDSGTCTNVASATGRTVSYGFRVPAGARIAVEIEPCAPGARLPRYVLRVATARGIPLAADRRRKGRS